jgi:NAD(P)-dependent dehydrogenase (short-subunit alcohol dehydrogenase family)
MLTSHNCLITGASRGLGASLAAAFWEAGANLLLVARSEDGLADLAKSLGRRAGQHLAVFAADLVDPTAPERIAAVAQKQFQTLDVLVNNAAIQGPIGPAWQNDWAAWQTTMQINLFAPVALCRLCVPAMIRRGHGKILNLSGGGAAAPRANFSAYGTAKAGLVRFSEILAQETLEYGIDVNCLAPGAMNTAMTADVIEAGPASAGQQEYEQALERRMEGGAMPEKAAALAVFLASRASDGLTGKLLSAVWDPWETLPEHLAELEQSDIYTLRRIVPKDRGLDWGERV